MLLMGNQFFCFQQEVIPLPAAAASSTTNSSSAVQLFQPVEEQRLALKGGLQSRSNAVQFDLDAMQKMLASTTGLDLPFDMVARVSQLLHNKIQLLLLLQNYNKYKKTFHIMTAHIM